MQIGDEITWRQAVRVKDARDKRVRFITGAIVGTRAGKVEREFEIAVRYLSGNLPDHPTPFMWVPENELLINRMIDHRHVNKVSPHDLIRRRVRQQAQRKLDVILANIGASPKIKKSSAASAA